MKIESLAEEYLAKKDIIKDLKDVPETGDEYVIEHPNGDRFFYNKQKLHREDGPAVVYADGEKHWYTNGRMNRNDGPAVEYPDGAKCWVINDRLHRRDGPAIELGDGSKLWYAANKLHREDGPAVTWANKKGGSYYLKGEKLSKKDFEKVLGKSNNSGGKKEEG